MYVLGRRLTRPTRAAVLRGLGYSALALPLAIFLVMLAFPRLDPMIMAFTVHFYVVGFTALGAALACAVIMASAQTLRNTRLVFLGLGFFVIAGVFSVHGLATPGFLADEYYVSVTASSWLSAALGSGFIAMSVVGLPRGAAAAVERNGRLLFAATAAAVGLYVALGLFVESWLDWVPIQERSVQLPLGIASLAATVFAISRYYQAWQFARLPSQLAMVASLIFLLEVQTIIIWGRVWHLSWWLYHGLYGVAIAVLFIGWAIEVRRAGTLRAIADALSMRDALAQLNRGLDRPIVQLVDAVEAKDAATFGHVRRVSGYALAIGRRLELSAAELRALVLAAEMHDVGKISVPSSILAKQGPLTADEYNTVKQHTEQGYEIASRVPALRDIATIIRWHHERLDGSGYPDRLVGEQVPFLARVIAVADTYDALTSKRPYRDAVGHVEAMAELFRLRGVQLDARCVDAFVAEFAEQGVRPLHEKVAA